ncbi:MAG: hypothetical protein ACFFFT_04970 [Candidatus Thorarchaeota archaeon]
MAETSDINKNLAELEEELKKIKSASDMITEARVSAVQTIKESSQLSQVSKELSENVKVLVSKIEKIDFPSRLDKVDATISGINAGMQNVQSRLDMVERHFDDSIKQIREDQKTQYDEIIKKLTQSNSMNKRLFNTSLIFNIIFLIILVLLIVILFIK